MAEPGKKKSKDCLDYEWPGTGKLKILLQGPRTAVLQFDPDVGLEGKIRGAQRGKKEYHTPSQKANKPAPTDGQTI